MRDSGGSSQGAAVAPAIPEEEVEEAAAQDSFRDDAHGECSSIGIAERSMHGAEQTYALAATAGTASSPQVSGSTADSESELQRNMDDANTAAEELLRVCTTVHGLPGC